MRLIKAIVLVSLLILLLVSLSRKWFQDEAVPTWDQSRTIKYAFELRNNSGGTKRNVQFKAYAPVALTAAQKVELIESSTPYQIDKDDFGNQLLIFDLPEIPPFSLITISIIVHLKLSSVVAQKLQPNSLYLAEQPMIEISDTGLIELARQIKSQNTSRLFPRAIYDWSRQHIEYSGYAGKDRGAVYALRNLQGDCTEFAYLATALARLLDIPARTVNGYIVTKNTVLKAYDYHTWSEMWFDGGWQIVDAQKGYFKERSDQYIAMSIYKVTGKEGDQIIRFFVSDEDISVKMK